MTEPLCLTELIRHVHGTHAGAGLPSASGDGLPHFLLAVHTAVARSAGAAPTAARAWLSQALALTLDAAEGAAPDVLFQQLSSEYSACLTADGLSLDDVAALGRCDTQPAALHLLLAEALGEFGRMSPDAECGHALMISPLSRLAAALAQALYELGESPTECVLDTDVLYRVLLPYRELAPC